MLSSSKVSTTTVPRATRRISARPAAGGSQWWTVKHAMAASTTSSPNGNASARPPIAGAAWPARWARMAALGSTASTARSPGSYDPVPAPTLSTVLASPRAARTEAAIRGSGRR